MICTRRLRQQLLEMRCKDLFPFPLYCYYSFAFHQRSRPVCYGYVLLLFLIELHEVLVLRSLFFIQLNMGILAQISKLLGDHCDVSPFFEF